MFLLGIKYVRLPYYQGFAAQLAFYFLLSIVPAIILLSQLLGVFAISLEVIEDIISEYIYGEAIETLRSFIGNAPSGPMNILFLLVTLWSASRVQFSMIRVMNLTMTDGQRKGGGFLKDRFKALKIILFTLFTITLALIILVYGEMILRMLFDPVNRALQIEYEMGRLLHALRWPAALVLYFFMVSFNYYALPYEKVKFKDILPGSIFASAAMLLVTFLYAIYITYVASFDIIYGSLAIAVALMLWFFFIAWALVLGIVFNKVFHETKNTAQSEAEYEEEG